MKTKKEPLLTRDVQREEPSNASIRMLAAAIRLAFSRNQTIGEKHEYYVTISQIDHIIQRASQTVTGARENEKPRPWIRTAEQRPTAKDANEKGDVWCSDLEGNSGTNGWTDVIDRSHLFPFWMPIPPVPEGQQTSSDTSVSSKQEHHTIIDTAEGEVLRQPRDLGLSVVERCAEKIVNLIWEAARENFCGEGGVSIVILDRQVADLINQEVNAQDAENIKNQAWFNVLSKKLGSTQLTHAVAKIESLSVNKKE